MLLPIFDEIPTVHFPIHYMAHLDYHLGPINYERTPLDI